MPITVNSLGNSGGQPSAPLRAVELDVDLDNSYPTGGYDVTADLPDGSTLRWSPRVQVSDGTTPILLALVQVGTSIFVQAFVEATGAEVANTTDLSAYTGVKVGGMVE